MSFQPPPREAFLFSAFSDDDSNSSSHSHDRPLEGTSEARVVSSIQVPTTAGGHKTVQQVEVVAPVDLPGGYEITVEINGSERTVVVPRGGVRQGESFRSRIVQIDVEDSVPEEHVTDGHDIPTGAWRDGVWDCWTHGVCHAHICLACWCCPIALGQIMTRMRLDWRGTDVGRRPVGWTPYKVLLLVTFAFVMMDHLLSIIILPYISGEENVVPDWAILFLAFRAIFRCMFLVYILVIMVRTRSFMRKKYAIREQYCSRYDDCLLSIICPCCSVAQMARHTANYRHSKAACCSETGLPPQAAGIV